MRSRTETVEETDQVSVQKGYWLTDLERMQIYNALPRGSSRDNILNMLCTPQEGNPNWTKLVRELEDECKDDLDGRLRRRTADMTSCDCEYDFSHCEVEVEAECAYESEKEVPYTETRQVCRDEPRRERVCPPRIVERLR